MAFQPRLPGVNLRVPGARPTDVQRFILANMDCLTMENGRDMDFQLGFGALRRTEMVKMCRKYGIDMDPNLGGEEIMFRMEQLFIDGLFPIPNAEDELQKKIDAAVEAKLKAILASRESEEEPTEKTVEETEDPLEPENVVRFEDMEWRTLQGLAKKAGFYKVGMKKDQVVDGLYAFKRGQ